jgi:glycosyl-4,4'-diaponeurosporenoate acyltransferase
MQIIFLTSSWTILLCFIVWPLLQVSAAFICLKLPERTFSSQSLLFRTYDFENGGRLYDRIFRVSKWKHLLPDGGMIWSKKAFRKKKLDSFSDESLTKFLIESGRAELTHWLAILPFWVFGFFAPARVIWYMLAYALIVNLPCIITQRYNRPRVQKLLYNRKNQRMDHH